VWISLRRVCGGCRVHLHSAGAMFFSCAFLYAVFLTMTDMTVIGAAYCGVKSLLALVPLIVPVGIYVVERLALHLKKQG